MASTLFNRPAASYADAKADKVTSAVNGNFAALDANGNLTDSGHASADYISASEKGAVSGVAELDSAGKVPASQLPSYVDDVIEYNSLSDFPATGESGIIYIAKDTNITYRWGGSEYVPIGSDLALGETSTTAYRGDRGAAAYAAAVTNVETTPTSASTNLITSGGVYAALPSDMTGATSSAAGAHGLVPAPGTTDTDKYLKGDGTWSSVDALPSVTSSDNGKVLEVVEGVWTTGEEKIDKNYDFDPTDRCWSEALWTGLTSFYGEYIWTDGNDIYYSNATGQYVLNKSTSTWSTKTWTGLTSFYGQYIWTDGDNIYYSYSSNNYILDKSTSTWTTKSWTGLTNFAGVNVWTDGDNIYYSNSSNQYVLDTSTSTWSAKTWTGLTSFNGRYIWTDGDNIYYSYSSNHYVLDKSTSTWTTKSWTGLTSFAGEYIWTDGDNIYYSSTSEQYVLNKSTSTWSVKVWDGLTSFRGNSVWTDGKKYYYSYDITQYSYGSESKILLGNDGLFSVASLSSIMDGKADKRNTVLTTTLSLNRKANTTVGTYSVAVGYDVTASGSSSHAEGSSTTASASHSHAEGTSTTASGSASHAEGSSTTASASYSHAEGYYTKATNSHAHAEGYYTQSVGNASHAEGYSSSNSSTSYGARGKADHVEGYNTLANSGSTSSYYGAHAEGNQTKATSNAAHAEGYYSTASGNYSHAEGYRSTASNDSSHAEGYQTTASSQYSHAEGYQTTASGTYSHAEGYQTTASGQYSHAEGNNTFAYEGGNMCGQHVFGRYNIKIIPETVTITDDIAEQWVPYKKYYYYNCVLKNTVDGVTTYYVPHADIPEYVEPIYDYQSSFWHSYSLPSGTDPSTIAEWDKDTLYPANSIVKEKSTDGVYYYFQNHNAITTTYYPLTGNMYHTQSLNSQFGKYPKVLEIVGNGLYSARSNARALDIEGNEYLAGDIYVGCNPDSTGGTKLEPLPAVTSSDNDKVLEVLNGEWAIGSEKLDKNYTCFLDGSASLKTWYGLTSFEGRYIWTDGENTYFSYGTTQYVLDKSTSTWSSKSWSGLTSFYGYLIWTDGDNIYYSDSSAQYVLDKSTSTWSSKSWYGLTGLHGDAIWTDGENTYFSDGATQYVLDKSTSTWSSKSWSGLTSFYGYLVWTDGENVYYGSGSNQYVLDISTSTWSTKTWSGLTSFDGINVWSDGNYVYYSGPTSQYVLNTSTSTWTEKVWTGLTSFTGLNTWTDGTNYYFSTGTNHFVFNDEAQLLLGQSGTFNPVAVSSVIPGVMTGATSSTAGTSGLVPAPSAGDEDKFLAGDGTWASGGKPMVILSYGNSTWNDFINAYNNNVIVYCRASSNSNPSTGAQNRMAFMAYVNDATTPTEVEFQYYRSVSSHTASQMGDQVFVYKLTSSGTWTVTTREASLKQITAGTGINVSWANNVATISGTYSAFTGADGTDAGTTGLVPAPTATDNNKYLKGDGTWASVGSTLPTAPSSDGTYFLQCTVSSGVASYSWVSIPAASGVSF